MQEINETVRNNILKARHKKGFSQEELGLRSGLHRAYVGQVERGEKRIGISNLKKIADALKLDIRDLFKPSGEK